MEKDASNKFAYKQNINRIVHVFKNKQTPSCLWLPAKPEKNKNQKPKTRQPRRMLSPCPIN